MANGRLLLTVMPVEQVEHEDYPADTQYLTGAVHTRGRATFRPPVYLEARIRAIDLPGATTAWWSKPDNGDWPPEIDFVEVPTARMGESMHNIHDSASEPGDGATHARASNGQFEPEGLTMDERFFHYSCLWTEEQITHWVDGQQVGQTTEPAVTSAVAAGAPFYMMLNTLAGRSGKRDFPPGEVPPVSAWGPYRTTAEVELVRIWQWAGAGQPGLDDMPPVLPSAP